MFKLRVENLELIETKEGFTIWKFSDKDFKKKTAISQNISKELIFYFVNGNWPKEWIEWVLKKAIELWKDNQNEILDFIKTIRSYVEQIKIEKEEEWLNLDEEEVQEEFIYDEKIIEELNRILKFQKYKEQFVNEVESDRNRWESFKRIMENLKYLVMKDYMKDWEEELSDAWMLLYDLEEKQIEKYFEYIKRAI